MTETIETTAVVTAAPAKRVRSAAEIKEIRRGYGMKARADGKAAARIKAIRQGYVDRKIKKAVEEKIANGKAVAKARAIADFYAKKAGVAA